MELEQELKSKQITLVVMPKDMYHTAIIKVITAVDKVSGKICYVTLNKPYKALIQDLKNNSMNPDKYFFIDALTATVTTPEASPNCEFVQSPSALTEISMAFTKATTDKKCDNVIFDSISFLSKESITSPLLFVRYNR